MCAPASCHAADKTPQVPLLVQVPVTVTNQSNTPFPQIRAIGSQPGDLPQASLEPCCRKCHSVPASSIGGDTRLRCATSALLGIPGTETVRRRVLFRDSSVVRTRTRQPVQEMSCLSVIFLPFHRLERYTAQPRHLIAV